MKKHFPLVICSFIFLGLLIGGLFLLWRLGNDTLGPDEENAFEPAEPEIAAVFQEAVDLALKTDQPCFLLEKIIEVQSRAGDLQGIETTLKKAIPEIRREEAAGFTYAPERFANILANAGRADLAGPLFDDSLENVRKIPKEDRKVVAMIAVSAFRLFNGNETEVAKGLFEEAEQIAINIDEEPTRSRALNAVAARHLEFCGCSNWKELSYARSDVPQPDFKNDRDAVLSHLSKAENIIPLIEKESLARELAIKTIEVRIELHDYQIALETIERDYPENLDIRTFFIRELLSDPDSGTSAETLDRLVRMPFEIDETESAPETFEYVSAVISALAHLHRFEDATEWSTKIPPEALDGSPYSGFSFEEELDLQTALALGEDGKEELAIASLEKIQNENRRRHGFRRLAVLSARRVLNENGENSDFERAYTIIERIIRAESPATDSEVDHFTAELVSLVELRYFNGCGEFVVFLNKKVLENLLATEDCHEKAVLTAVLLATAIERSDDGHRLEKTLLPVVERIFVREAGAVGPEDLTGRLFDIIRSLQILRNLKETDPLDRIADAVVRRAQAENMRYLIDQIFELRPFDPPHNLDVQGELEKARLIESPSQKSLHLLRLAARMSGLREI